MLGSLIAILIFLVAGTVFIIAKYNGSRFKATTESTISELSGASETSITQLRVTPISAKAAKAKLIWDQHSFLQSATFVNLRADIKLLSFFSSDWIGEEVVARLGRVYLQTPSSSREDTSDPIISPYRFSAFRSSALDLYFGKAKNAPAILGLKNVELRQKNDGTYQIVFHNGTMHITHWPELTISSGIVTMGQHDIKINTLLKSGENYAGELIINGRIAKDTSRPVVLDVKAKGYPIQDLLGKELGRIIQGEIRSDMGSLSYNYKKPQPDALSFIMPFNSSELTFSDLPLFTELKNLTGNTHFVRPVFSSCHGTIMRTSEGVTLNDLKLSNTNTITLSGSISVNAADRLSGTLVVGVHKTYFNAPPPKIFTGPVDGFYTTTVTLSGNIHNPNDNLRELLGKNQSQSAPTLTPDTGTILPGNVPQRRDDRQKEQEFDDLTH